MTSFFVGFIQSAFFLLASALSLAAVLAGFGFAVPLLDTLNHLQPLWFFGTLACLLLAGLVFRRQRSRALVIALTATGFLASGIIVMPEFISGFLARPVMPAGTPSYRLMTYNVFGMNDDMNRVAAMIEAESPDIIALNEYYPEQRTPLHPLIVDTYPYFAICTGGKRANLAIYARIPFETDGSEPCNWDADHRTGYLAAHFAPPTGSAFTVMATQLDWPLQISPLAADGDILTRIENMTARQEREFAHLATGLDAIMGPVLLAGDFNSTSWSYALKRFAQQNGLTRQTRNLATFPKLWFFDTWRTTPAFLPLDQIMSRSGIVVTALHAGDPAGSDHRPVIADFTIPPSLRMGSAA